jgi:hypothetical protein
MNENSSRERRSKHGLPNEDGLADRFKHLVALPKRDQGRQTAKLGELACREDGHVAL